MEKKEFLKVLGNNIKELRSKKGINQAELARRCEKERSSIERIENGKINTSVFIIYEIAIALDVHPKEIFEFHLE